MNNCIYAHRWNRDLDFLSEKEFEALLEHTDNCDYHARVLDEYNDGNIRLLQKAMPEAITAGRLKGIARAGIFRELFNLKIRGSREFSPAFTRGLGVAAASALLGIGLAAALSVDNFGIGTVILQWEILAALVLLFTLIYPRLRGQWRFDFMTSTNGTGLLYRGDGTEEFNTYNKSIVGKVPERLQPKGMTADEKAISEELKKLLKTGFNPENCIKCLAFLDEHEFVVRESWVHILNRVRFLRGSGEKEEASRILHAVLEEYSDVPEAAGTAYEVLSWFDELEYNEGGELDSGLIDRRYHYIAEGLKFFPGSYQLLLNAFEVSIMRGENDRALNYLDELAKVDGEIAKRYFADNPRTEEIKKTDWEIKRKIVSIVEGNFRLAKTGAAALILLLTFGLLIPTGIGSLSAGKALPGNDPGQMTKRDGTSVGIAKETKGTSVGVA
jgi:hypothetical protein